MAEQAMKPRHADDGRDGDSLWILAIANCDGPPRLGPGFGGSCFPGDDICDPRRDEFRPLDLARIKAAMAKPVMVDLRSIYPVKTMKALGFRYVCVGRGFGGEG